MSIDIVSFQISIVDAVDVCGFDARVVRDVNLSSGEIAGIEMGPLAHSDVTMDVEQSTEKTALLGQSKVNGKTPKVKRYMIRSDI